MTEFQKKVYNIVKKIPVGKVLTYKQVAQRIGEPKAARAVGNALNKNRDKNVPCYRVVCSDGRIGGYAAGTKKKSEILRKERIKIKNLKIISSSTRLTQLGF